MSAIDIKDYFNHETRICLLEKCIVDINETMKEIKSDIKYLSNKIDIIDSRLESKIDRLYWAIIGIYGTGFITLLGYFVKSHNWFS